MPRILVTYATRYGSTVEVAEAIGEELTAAGFDVDVLATNPGLDLRKYDAAVVGSPAYGEKWMAMPTLFLIGNAALWERIPVALFTVGMLGLKNPKMALKEHNRLIAEIQAETPGLIPVSTALFHGSFSRSHLPFCLRIMDILAGTPQGDHRDWDAIRGWAQRVGAAFHERLGDDDAPSAEPEEEKP